jgi:hemerythrin-like metal-binding protein
MTLIIWNSKLSVDINSLDNQHKMLISMINDFYDNITNRPNSENVAKILAGLKNYTIEHFSYEEKLMKQFRYSLFNSHIKEHEFFIRKVTEIEEKVNAGKLVLSLDITSFLYEWLKNHIQVSDKKYTDLFIKNNVK